MNRRTFLKYLSAVGAVTAIDPSRFAFPQVNSNQQPNFLIILTDQERFHMHWPKGFAKEHLSSWERLRKKGLTFNNAYCTASQCSPSRACILTGQYSNVNKVPVLNFPGGLPDKTTLPNIGSWLKEKAGYDVVWKGKWHLSYPVGFEGGPPDGEVWTYKDIVEMENKYGLSQWNPPEAGNNVTNSAKGRATMGGGSANNDGRFINGDSSDNKGQTQGIGESAIDFIRRAGAVPHEKRRPFCLFVSLVNPHDIAYFPNGWDQGGYNDSDLKDLDIALPPNFVDDLSTKPKIQKQFYNYLQKDGPLDTEIKNLNYVKFYAYLHILVNRHIEALLDALDYAGLTNDTIIFRSSDHGEHGLSHGLREKAYTAYEEIIHIPFTISNPVLFPQPAETDAFYSHIDLSATISHLAGTKTLGLGKSQVPVIFDPSKKVRDEVLFTYDDCFFLPSDAPGSHIRTLRNSRYTYAVYYSADGSDIEYELYDNHNDPYQMINLAYKPVPDIKELWVHLHTRLTDNIKDMNSIPAGFKWPENPF